MEPMEQRSAEKAQMHKKKKKSAKKHKSWKFWRINLQAPRATHCSVNQRKANNEVQRQTQFQFHSTYTQGSAASIECVELSPARDNDDQTTFHKQSIAAFAQAKWTTRRCREK